MKFRVFQQNRPKADTQTDSKLVFASDCFRGKSGRSEDSIRLLIRVFSAVGVCSDLADKAKPAERRGRKATGPCVLRDAFPTTPRRTQDHPAAEHLGECNDVNSVQNVGGSVLHVPLRSAAERIGTSDLGIGVAARHGSSVLGDDAGDRAGHSPLRISSYASS